MALVKKTFELSRRFGDNHAAARPKRFFEFPYCTESFIPFESEISTEELFVKMADGYKLGGHGTVICSVFNWDAVKKNIMFNARDYFEIYDDDTVTSKFIAEEIWTGRTF